ncbi:MetQ/NlpA family ABC transporter substrate-binding protein [Peptacetobacter sp.]|uniref:MetQ/NlpA family ABC transporter substrate-binding protein n=1 Tax=Peptacetobacter sp. TaxID=2991975 RepID=UPI0026285921|nr:MetQ/NlpA family ABC transporter substrate-binding protein [Peptacetobacter sp.]
MKFKKILSVAIASVIALSVVGCGGKTASDDKKIIVGASSNPHAVILNEAVKPLLEKDGYKLEVQEFSDYVLPNTALDDGSLDANYFQHIPYLKENVKEKGYKLTYTAKVHIEPMGVYSKKIKSLDDLKDGAKIAIPNDPTNGSRALELLAKNNVIKLKDKELVTKLDITENPKNIEIIDMNAEQLPTALEDVDCAVINANYALEADLKPTKDAIVIESSDSPYANILACREDNKDSEKIKALTKALNSKETKKYIEEKYDGAIIPAF